MPLARRPVCSPPLATLVIGPLWRSPLAAGRHCPPARAVSALRLERPLVRPATDQARHLAALLEERC